MVVVAVVGHFVGPNRGDGRPWCGRTSRTGVARGSLPSTPTEATPMETLDVLSTRPAELGATVRLHARAVGGDAEVGHLPDDLVPLASTFKVLVLLELHRQAAAGELDLARRLVVTPDDRVLGPTGLSILTDPVELSLRDLAVQMTAVSDNTATDVVMGVVGVDRMAATAAELGLDSLAVPHTCREVLDGLGRDAGTGDAAGFAALELDALAPDARDELAERIRRSPTLAPSGTNQATSRDLTRLLELVWTDAAGPPAACAEVRRVLGLQVFRDRLASGFPDAVAVAGKTGTLPFLRNEIGVVTDPDGRSWAVAVSVTTDRWGYRLPELDWLVGWSARAAVQHLRAVA